VFFEDPVAFSVRTVKFVKADSTTSKNTGGHVCRSGQEEMMASGSWTPSFARFAA